MTKAIMLQGTGSDVGKTVLVAGLCRLLASRGLRVRPFKPQNMSNNAAVSHDATPGEMGRAQWLQAKAARVAPSVHMNPVLLKPQSETGSQIILQGKVHGSARGRDYQRLKPQLLSAVLESFAIVSADADLVIVEGAGSPAEINLRAGDIANMGFATAANVPVVLIGDIDRGGVIASLVGTHAILDATDRAMIAGYIINKFRGDVSLFDDGLQAITKHTGWPALGVVPWLDAAARLPAEDSVALERMSRSGTGRLKVAVPLLGRIANFDDLDPLAAEPSVDLFYVRPGEPLPEDTALVVLPGSKSTIGDLRLLREAGFDGELRAHHARGGHVVGLCGGYQMLGRSVRDPLQADGDESQTAGLGLLDTETVMAPEKTVRNVRAHSSVFDTDLEGYEIHLGQTTGPDCERPLLAIEGRPDGAMSADGRVFGTYLHGLFANDAFRAAYLRKLGADASSSSYDHQIETALDAIAERLGKLIDVDALLAIAASRSS